MQVSSTLCCGVRQMYHIEPHINEPSQGPEYVVREVCRNAGPGGGYRAAFYVFYDHRANEENSYGSRLAAFIRENNLGELVESPIRQNPNSNNQLKMYTWAIDINQLVLRFRPLINVSAGDRADGLTLLAATAFNLGDFVKINTKGRSVLAGRIADTVLNAVAFRIIGGHVGNRTLNIEIEGVQNSINIPVGTAQYFIKAPTFESRYQITNQ